MSKLFMIYTVYRDAPTHARKVKFALIALTGRDLFFAHFIIQFPVVKDKFTQILR